MLVEQCLEKKMITPEGIGLKQSIYIALKVHQD